LQRTFRCISNWRVAEVMGKARGLNSIGFDAAKERDLARKLRHQKLGKAAHSSADFKRVRETIVTAADAGVTDETIRSGLRSPRQREAA
jgi:hypothetical protein